MHTRRELHVGQKVTLRSTERGTVVPTSGRVPLDEVNVMLDHTGEVVTVELRSIHHVD